MPVHVLNSFNSGQVTEILNGINYATDHGANIINLSLTLNPSNKTVEEAIQHDIEKNNTFVIAAGNYNSDDLSFFSPCMNKCITIAAVDSNLKRK